jgi:hypothetical protein
MHSGKLYSMEPFTINLDNQKFKVIPLEEKDQMLYQIFSNDLLCLIGLNENDEWESNNDCPQELIKKIGETIEDKDD